MSCVKVTRIPDPDLAISVLLPDLSLSPPSLGVSLCCTLETPPIPGFPILVPISALLAPLGSTCDTIIAAIDTAIAALNQLLDEIPPLDCPFDE